MKYLKDNIFLKNWFIADVTNTPSDEVMANNPLVFLLPIRIDSKIEGYLFLHCSLKQLIKDLEYEDNIFLSGSSMILSDDSSYALLMENKRSSSEVYSKIPFENYKNLSLIYYSPKIILTGDLAFIGLIFGIIFLLFLIFGFWWIKTYIKSIILPLENLSDSMRKYIEIQKNKMF